MTKAEFIATLSKDTKFSKKDTEGFLEAFLSNITKVLKKKDTLSFKGFGSFSAAKRSTRIGINPRTKEKIKIPASIVPKFTASKILKEAMNGKK